MSNIIVLEIAHTVNDKYRISCDKYRRVGLERLNFSTKYIIQRLREKDRIVSVTIKFSQFRKYRYH